MYDDIFSTVAETLRLVNSPQPLAAIWLNRSILGINGRTCRIAPGDKIKIEDLVEEQDGVFTGEVVDCDKPTHEVISCIGALNHSFAIQVVDLETNQIFTFKL